MKRLIFVPLLIGLGACSKGGDPAIQGSADSNVRQLNIGMGEAEVTRIIGAFQNESFDASDSAFSCRSYLYDEVIDAKFVYVLFDSQKVISASDGHRSVCQFSEGVS